MACWDGRKGDGGKVLRSAHLLLTGRQMYKFPLIYNQIYPWQNALKALR